MRLRIGCLTYLLLCLSGALMRGDSPGASRHQGWRDGTPIWLDRAARCLESESLDAKGQLVRTQVPLRMEEGRTALGWGEVWQVRPVGQGLGVYRSPEGRDWTLMGEMKVMATPRMFVPLGSDRLLVLAGSAPFVMGEKASPLAIFRRKDDGQFSLEDLIHPLTSPLLERLAKPGGGLPQDAPGLFQMRPNYKLFAARSFVFSHSPFIALPKGAALVSYHTGHIWIFGGEGEIRRHVMIFEGLSEAKFSQLLSFEGVLLGAVPTPEGKLLLASRSEEAVFEAQKKYPVVDYSKGKGVLTENSHANQMAITFLFPDIRWWELDPETGKLERLTPPPRGAPELLPADSSLAQLWLQAFQFELASDGSLVLKMEELARKHLSGN